MEKNTEIFHGMVRYREELRGVDVDPVTKLVKEEWRDLGQVLHHFFPRFLI